MAKKNHLENPAFRIFRHVKGAKFFFHASSEVPAMAAHGLDVEATAKRCMGAL